MVNIPGRDDPSDPKRPPCTMYDLTFRTAGLADTFTEGGRYPWRDKVYPGYWPVVWGWSFQGPVVGDEASLTTVILGVKFEQTQTVVAPVVPAAWQIFRDNLPPFSTLLPPPPVQPTFPSAVNTNWGAGWIVPAFDGLPMDLVVEIEKNPNNPPIDFPYSGVFNAIWSYERIGALR